MEEVKYGQGAALRVMGSVDPFFDKRSSLYKSGVQLRIGFEIGSFRKIKKEVKELIPMDKLKDKGFAHIKDSPEILDWLFSQKQNSSANEKYLS